MMTISTIGELQRLLKAQGVSTAYVKRLAPKQDNEKNQIYFGDGLDTVTNLFPATIAARSASTSTRKRASKEGESKLEARIPLAWLGDEGKRYPAPEARIIDYFQYPEIRFSGFLSRCRQPPDALRRKNQSQYGARILILGTAYDGVVVGLVLTERDDPVVADFPDLPALPGSGVFRILTVDGAAGVEPREILNSEIRTIVGSGWQPSVILKAGVPVPFSGAQGAGYTLEALLGVTPNAAKGPDRHGFEIKTYSQSRISLMTPTPDEGFQGMHPFREFMDRYGRPSQKDDGSLRFVGLFRTGEINPTHRLGLRVTGYDSEGDRFSTDVREIGVQLADPDSGNVAARWSLERLANCWNQKHAAALYIRSEKNPAPDDPARTEYRYLSPWLLGEGTDVWRLLRAIASGHVFYDPADTIYANGKAKVRSQWRVNAGSLRLVMERLYARVTEVSV